MLEVVVGTGTDVSNSDEPSIDPFLHFVHDGGNDEAFEKVPKPLGIVRIKVENRVEYHFFTMAIQDGTNTL